MMLQAALGLEFDIAAGEVRLTNPIVPHDVGEITIRGLRLGGASVDFAVRRDGQDASLRVLRSNGSLRVTMASPSPKARRANFKPA
jgi:hypothetical protein